METNRVVGVSVPLKDAREKVTGVAKYTADIQLPDMLHAKILGSPHPHALVKSISTREAEALLGVKGVITCKDVPRTPFFPHETRQMYTMDDHVRSVGEEVAAVAAESEEIAEEALRLIKVDYEVLPAVFDPVGALKPNAPKLWPEGNLSDPESKHVLVEWGDPDAAFAKSDVTVEGAFKTQIQVPAPIEPRACVAQWDGSELTAWVSTQWPHAVREDIARVLSLPLSRVRVITDYFGGGFGGKKQDRYPIIAALLAVKTRRPVKLEFTRSQEHTITRRRYSSTARLKMGASKDGTITAIDFEAYYDVGAHGTAIGGSLFFLVSQFYVYKFPSARFKAWDVNTNLVTAQPFRGVQMPAFHFGLEQLVDALAEKLQMDPAQFRLKNTYRQGDALPPYKAAMSSFGIEEAVNAATQAIGWKNKWRGWGTQSDASGPKRRGVGFGVSMGWCDWERQSTAASVKVERDGSAVLMIGTQDIGTGSKTTLSQIVADALGISFEDVTIVTGDTKATPHDYGCCASRTLYIGGTAAKLAADEAKHKILELAAPILQASPNQLALRDKKVFPIDSPSKGVPIMDILHSSVEGFCLQEPTPTVAPLREALVKGGAVGAVIAILNDPEVTERAHAAGVGAEFEAALGGKSGQQGQRPFAGR
ncbi:MAG: molybdopterin cofactor-binding domain-containing protein, partial [Candidatus Bathyarchaeia archaeon]